MYLCVSLHKPAKAGAMSIAKRESPLLAKAKNPAARVKRVMTAVELHPLRMTPIKQAEDPKRATRKSNFNVTVSSTV